MITFNEFCEKFCDKMYDPLFPEEEQCTGYKLLKKMVKENIKPATEKQFNRWNTHPTTKELLSAPDLKYLTFLHANLRPIIRNNWKKIKKLKMD